MKLEWDERERWRNIDDRGLDFMDVEFMDWSRVETRPDTRKDYPERRYVPTGQIGSRVVVCVWCRRGDAVRIISLRKANGKERQRYQGL